MCIMEMNPQQRNSTKYMALAHNIRTVISDLDLLERTHAAHHPGGDPDAADVAEGRRHLEAAYAVFLGLFQTAVGAEHMDPEGHVHVYPEGEEHNHPHTHGDGHEEVTEARQIGNERRAEKTLVGAADHDARLAAPFETR